MYRWPSRQRSRQAPPSARSLTLHPLSPTHQRAASRGSISPPSIVGQGPHGEKAASPEVLKLSDADAEKVKAGHFKVGILMQTVNLDWSQLQVQGITDTLKKYGVSVTGVASAEYQVDKQIADIENTIQQHPDGIISIPVDFTATAPTYKKVSQAGIKLVFMDSIPTGLEH